MNETKIELIMETNSASTYTSSREHGGQDGINHIFEVANWGNL